MDNQLVITDFWPNTGENHSRVAYRSNGYRDIRYLQAQMYKRFRGHMFIVKIPSGVAIWRKTKRGGAYVCCGEYFQTVELKAAS